MEEEDEGGVGTRKKEVIPEVIPGLSYKDKYHLSRRGICTAPVNLLSLMADKFCPDVPRNGSLADLQKVLCDHFGL